MKFDKFTIVLLVLRPDAPRLDGSEAAALQDAHLAHLAKLYDAGYLLAAGPLLGPEDHELRGLSIFLTDPEKTRMLSEQDPAVQAGRFSLKITPWMVPSGAIDFKRAHFPSSSSEADRD
ncbi:MAG TPA: YciI family protein [Candidatus Bathyarchaeia archaeon]|nr:YciI family protein [Candidatus Bathyarchaeia archaeon]